MNAQNALLLHDYKNADSGALHLKPAGNWVVELGIISYYNDNYWMKDNWLPACPGGDWSCFGPAGITGYGRSSATSQGSYGKSWEAFKIKLYGNDAGGNGDYLSIDIDNEHAGIDKFRYKTKGSMEGRNTRIGNSNNQGGRDNGGAPYNGALAVIFLGATYVKTGCKDHDANNTCSDCTDSNPSECRYDNTTITEVTSTKASGDVGLNTRLGWKITSPKLETVVITKISGGATDKTFPLTVTNQGKNGFINVKLNAAGSYRFKVTATGVGNKTSNKNSATITTTVPSPDAVFGCTDSSASNYNSAATSDDGTCIISGCMDSTANNYNSAATVDAGCEYPEADACTTTTDCGDCEKCEADSDGVNRCVTDPDCGGDGGGGGGQPPVIDDPSGCVAKNRFTPASGSSDCGDCTTGYEENDSGDCVAVSADDDEDEEESALSPLMIGGGLAGVALLAILLLKK